DVRARLHSLQHVEAAAAALSLGTVRRISDNLQLAQNELRHHHHAVDESGLGDVRDAPVDNDAGIENLCAFARGALTSEEVPEGSRVEQVAFAGADEQAD